MKHPSEDELVLHYFGEAGADAATPRHLEGCPSCRERYAGLQGALAVVSDSSVPERDESYGRQVWARIRSEVETTPIPGRWRVPGRFLSRPRLALAGGVAVLVVAAFAGGRVWQSRIESPVPPVQTAVSVALQGQEQVLMAAVGQHFERSARILVEIANVGGGQVVDISNEQAQASDLIAANRLYRQAALRSGENGLASVLEDLERVLAEVTNSSPESSAAEREVLRRRVDDSDLLFKVRVAESQIRQRQIELALSASS
jgi:hypothetical protein